MAQDQIDLENEWPGIDQRNSLIGHGWDTLDNVSHIDKAVLRRRPGLAGRVAAQSGSLLAAYGGRIVMQTASAVVTIDPSNGTTSSLSAISGTAAGSFARYLGRMYWTRGDASPIAFDSITSAGRSVGITAPSNAITGTVAAGGTATVGSHIFRYRYKNSTTGFISNPSAAITLAYTSGNQQSTDLAVVASATAGVDKIILEVTAANASTFYQAAEYANTSTNLTFTMADAVLTAKIPSVVYGDDGHNPMPSLDLIAEHRNRLFGIQKSTKLIGWSRPGFPESWDLTTYARKLSQIDDTNDTVTGMTSFLGDLYVMQRYGMSRYSYVDDPSNGVILYIPTQEGLWNPRCMIQVADRLFGFGPAGIWAISAINPQHISTEIDPWIEDNMDTSKADQFFAWYNWRDRSVSFGFVANGDTQVKRAATFCLRNGAWSTRSYKHELLGSVTCYNETYITTNNGYLWKERPGYFGGVATAVKYAVASGSSTTTINVTTSVNDCVGATLTIGTETRYITSYGANSMTVSSAFTSAPAAGTIAQLGQVVVTIESMWRPSAPGRRELAPYAFLECEPCSTGNAVFRCKSDFSSSYATYSASGGDTAPAGVTVVDGSTDCIVDMSAAAGREHLAIPTDSNYTRTIAMYLRVDDPVTPLGIMSLDMVTREYVKKTEAPGE